MSRQGVLADCRAKASGLHPSAISNYRTACPLPCDSCSGLRTETQIYATSTEQLHNSHQHRVHAEGLLHFSVRVGTSHTQHDCKLDNLRAGFEIAEGYKIGHGPDANIHHAVGQGGLF